MLAVGEAAAAQQTAVALIVDEIQYLSEADRRRSSWRLIGSIRLSLVLFGAGLPQVRGKMGEAKVNVERLFDFPEVDALNPSDARRAIVEPAREEGWSSKRMRLMRSCASLPVIPIFCRNGDTRSGNTRTPHRSAKMLCWHLTN